jgi:hypothetical protein
MDAELNTHEVWAEKEWLSDSGSQIRHRADRHHQRPTDDRNNRSDMLVSSWHRVPDRVLERRSTVSNVGVLHRD